MVGVFRLINNSFDLSITAELCYDQLSFEFLLYYPTFLFIPQSFMTIPATAEVQKQVGEMSNGSSAAAGSQLKTSTCMCGLFVVGHLFLSRSALTSPGTDISVQPPKPLSILQPVSCPD